MSLCSVDLTVHHRHEDVIVQACHGVDEVLVLHCHSIALHTRMADLQAP